MNLKDEAERAGITFRQARHWGTKGWIRVYGGGSGQGPVQILSEDARVLRVMADLIHAGIAVEKAAEVARDMVENRSSLGILTDTVTVVVSRTP